MDKFSKVTAMTATRPSGFSTSYQVTPLTPYRNGDISPGAYTITLTDELRRQTSPNFYQQHSFNVYWPLELELGGVTYPEGNSVGMPRDARMRLTGVTTTPKPNMGQAVSSTASYTDCADWTLCTGPDYTIDLRNNRTDFTYDTVSGLVLTKTGPADANGVRPQTRYFYQQLQAVYKNASGQLVQSGSPIWKLTSTSSCQTKASCAGTADEVVTTIGYDGNLLPTTETISAGDGSVTATTTKVYDAVGNVISVDGPLAGPADTTRYFYDAARQLTGEIGPDPDGTGPLPYPATRYSYNLDGQVTLVEHGSATAQSDTGLSNMAVFEQVATAYDTVGRKISDTKSSGGTTYAVTQYSYDLDSHLICTAVRMDPSQWSGQTDACVPQLNGSNGPDRITKNVYDAAGQLLQVRKAVGTSLEQAYATSAYSPNGKQTDMIDANGNRAQMTYDGFDRQTRWLFPSPTAPSSYAPSTPANAFSTAGAVSTTDYEEYGYDAAGNRTSVRKRDGRTLTFAYDALNRITSKLVPDGCPPIQVGACPAASATRDVYYGYDLRGLQTYARFDSASGEGVTNGYDALGRLASSTTAMGGFSRSLGYKYDAAGNRTRITHPDGVYFDMSYDGLDRMVNAWWTAPGTNHLQFLGISYDAQGRRSNINRASSNTGYNYDSISRLMDQDQRFAGGSGNTTSHFTYNPASQITSETRGNNDFVFNGYLVGSKTFVPNGLNQYTSVGTNAYQYDANGNLVSDGGIAYVYDAENRMVTASSGATLTYDPLGRLWQVGTSAATTQFLYDGDALVAEYDGSGAMLRRYMHGPGVDEPILADEGGALNCSGTKFLHTDHQGSVVALADCSGNRTNVNAYDEYGVPRQGNVGRFQYTGQAWLQELRMYYYKARMYSPMLGRFMQTDPIGYKDQNDLYAYVANDPVNRTDSSGLGPLEIVLGGLDIAQTASDIKNGASWGTLAMDAGNLVLDVQPIPGLSEAAHVAEGARLAEHGVEAVRAERTVAHGLPKPPTGPGSVPRSERDPRRTFSPSERAAQREAQGGRCANGCGTKIDASNSQGHHVDRHADGGPTSQPNHAEVCIDCHKKLHYPD